MIDPEDIAYEDRVSGDAASYTGNGSGEDDGNNEDWAQAWEDYNSHPLKRVTIVTNK